MHSDVERVARAVAVADGYDPDEIMTPHGGLRWRYYVPLVPVAMAATREIDAERVRNLKCHEHSQYGAGIDAGIERAADWLLERAKEARHD